MYVNNIIYLQENIAGYGINGKAISGHVTVMSPGLIKCYINNLDARAKYTLYLFSNKENRGVRVGDLVPPTKKKETKWMVDERNILGSRLQIGDIDGALIAVEGDAMRTTNAILTGFVGQQYSLLSLLEQMLPTKAAMPKSKSSNKNSHKKVRIEKPKPVTAPEKPMPCVQKPEEKPQEKPEEKPSEQVVEEVIEKVTEQVPSTPGPMQNVKGIIDLAKQISEAIENITQLANEIAPEEMEEAEEETDPMSQMQGMPDMPKMPEVPECTQKKKCQPCPRNKRTKNKTYSEAESPRNILSRIYDEQVVHNEEKMVEDDREETKEELNYLEEIEKRLKSIQDRLKMAGDNEIKTQQQQPSQDNAVNNEVNNAQTPIGVEDIIKKIIGFSTSTPEQTTQVTASPLAKNRLESLYRTNKKVKPFQKEDTSIEWCNISLSELLSIPDLPREWCNQPLVTFSYYKYHTLLLGHNKETNNYYIGIPDLYHPDRKKFLESDKLIQHFTSRTALPPTIGDYGYWIAKL